MASPRKPRLLALPLALATGLGCGQPLLCDIDGDGVCAPLDCDEYDPLVGECLVSPTSPPTPSATAPLDLSPGTSLNASQISHSVGYSKRGESLGSDIAQLGDINNDGFDDLLVGAYTYWRSNSDTAEGAAYLIRGPIEGATSLDALIGSGKASRWAGTSSPGGLGFSVAAMDLNGDGARDVVLGAPGIRSSSYVGRIYIDYAPFDSMGAERSIDEVSMVLEAERADDWAGFDLANAGDINNDGIQDLMVGAPNAADEDGKVYVLPGPVLPEDFGPLDDLGDAAIVLVGEATERAGWSVAGPGDVNGDGYDDLLIGAWWGSPTGRGVPTGAAYLVFGPLEAGTLKLKDVGGAVPGARFFGADAADGAGRSVAGAGDLNADGLADLIIGADGDDYKDLSAGEGAAYVVFGSTTLSGDINLQKVGEQYQGAKLYSEVPGASTGYSVSGAGDVNLDGFDDLLVGAPHEDVSAEDAEYGAAYLLFGGATPPQWGDGYLADYGLKIYGQRSFDSVGYAVSAAGDLNDDGFGDVAFSALTGRTAGGAEEFVRWDGIVYTLYGHPLTP